MEVTRTLQLVVRGKTATGYRIGDRRYLFYVLWLKVIFRYELDKTIQRASNSETGGVLFIIYFMEPLLLDIF